MGGVSGAGMECEGGGVGFFGGGGEGGFVGCGCKSDVRG